MRSHRCFCALRLALAAFLLAAAALKLHGLAIDPVTQESFLASPRLELAAIEIETILGLWLLSGWRLHAAWMAALAFFAGVACASLYLALHGQSSCGCFGKVVVSPWAALAIDLAALVALLVFRPPRSASERLLPALRRFLPIAAGAAAFVSLLGATFVVAFKDPALALARLRGESLTIEPSVSQVGEGVAGEERAFHIRVHNHSPRSIRILGGTTTCSCLASGDLPVLVPPGGSRPIEVRVRFTGSIGRFSHAFNFYTDVDGQPLVAARFAGRVVAREPTVESQPLSLR